MLEGEELGGRFFGLHETFVVISYARSRMRRLINHSMRLMHLKLQIAVAACWRAFSFQRLGAGCGQKGSRRLRSEKNLYQVSAEVRREYARRLIRTGCKRVRDDGKYAGLRLCLRFRHTRVGTMTF